MSRGIVIGEVGLDRHFELSDRMMNRTQFLAFGLALGSCTPPSPGRTSSPGMNSSPGMTSRSSAEGRCIRSPIADRLGDAGRGAELREGVSSLADGKANDLLADGGVSASVRWRPALEGYVPSVRRGDHAPFQVKGDPFGRYLV